MGLRLIRFEKERHLNFVSDLTQILHSAYRPLAEQGMRYLASHQSAEKTLERLLEGESYLCFADDELAGTVTLYHSKPESTCEYYRREYVFSFGQFAIKPALQKRGFGSKIMDFIEKRARERGAFELALDTSEHANHLISSYEKRGYKIVAFTQWDVTNYKSVIMTKILTSSENREFPGAAKRPQESLQLDH